MLLLCSAMLVSVLSSIKQRRQHFWMRAALLLLVPALVPALLALSEAVGLVGEGTLLTTGLRIAVACPLALILAPVLLCRGSHVLPGDSRDDFRGGGEPRPEPPRNPLDHPDGGIPLLDADQCSTRQRDHADGWRRWRGPRRPAREPERIRTRVT